MADQVGLRDDDRSEPFIINGQTILQEPSDDSSIGEDGTRPMYNEKICISMLISASQLHCAVISFEENYECHSTSDVPYSDPYACTSGM